MSCEKFHIADIVADDEEGQFDATEISVFVDTDEAVTIHVFTGEVELTFRTGEQGLFAIQHVLSDAGEKLGDIIEKNLYNKTNSVMEYCF